MRIRLAFWILIAVLAAPPMIVATQAPPTAKVTFADIGGLAWMAGAWSRTEGERTTEEHWMAPAGGLMLGMHRDVRGGDVAEFEFMRIESRPEGVFYVASPNAGPATAFRLVERGPNRVVFHNPDHDFPARILYWLDGDGAMHARIEGHSGENGREWVWRPAPPEKD